MHILNVTTASLDDLIEPVDLGQAPAELVAASFSDSDLAALAGAWGPELPELRLAALRDLRHPMSVDLWIERVASGARAVLVRLLGGYDWWAYGCERLAAVARERGIALALLPGECRADDPRLAALSTVGPGARAGLLACFREGGRAVAAPAAAPLPRVGLYLAGAGVRGLEAAEAAGRPLVAVLFYRSMLLANDHAPVDALVAALEAEGLAARAVFLPNLREPEVLAALEPALRRMRAAAIVTATAFAAGEEAGLFARLGVPVFQVVPATTRREAWAEGQRGLMPADLAMHVVLPELDGRILAGAVSFKEVAPLDVRLGLRLQRNRPEAGRVAQVARRVAAHLALAATPP
ncbi:cobaltochelatase subunit CobN, partial [uncultured Amaricoccus sp.]|uniref:cobaltochelatase subunit CobN n=1 Tax=uncultured Amaricoccus sp. TaxID=339341 RepID=UPI002610B33F